MLGDCEPIESRAGGMHAFIQSVAIGLRDKLRLNELMIRGGHDRFEARLEVGG